MLDKIYRQQPGVTRCINAENPHGEKGGACTAASLLGPSRKGSPCIACLHAGETVSLGHVKGAGVIRHIWMTVCDATPASRFVLRNLILRMYWDGEEEPSVECPIGDFFLNGFARGYAVQSAAIAVNPKRGMNCYLPMPFGSGFRMTLESRHPDDIYGFFYQIDYQLLDELENDALRFHAQWRRQMLTEKAQDYVLLDGVKGRGHYVGTFLALSTLQRYWWGEGEVKFYIDGDENYPTVCSTGTEDYFGGAWSFGSFEVEQGPVQEKTYCTPFLGYPFYGRDDTFRNDFFTSECPPMRALYRWHLPDPVCFDQNLRVTLQQIGVSERGLFERQDDVSSVAYWYQTEPHQLFPGLPTVEECQPR